jgi:hypothetical protein
MRLACPEERLDRLPIAQVNLNVNCRDEIIPILRTLQHLYANVALRDQLLELVGRDVNQRTSRRRGRRGLNYWEITVLAAARLGCNLDYDKLQDLAENHRSLRQNVLKLRAQTLQKINDLVVQAGHALEPEAIAAVRPDDVPQAAGLPESRRSSCRFEAWRLRRNTDPARRDRLGR